MFGLNALALTLASQLNPTLIRRFGPANVLTGAILVSIVAAAALLAAGLADGSLATVLVPLTVLLAAAGLAMPNTPALALTRHGEAAGTASAMLGFVQFGVGAVVAPMVGVLGSTATALGIVILGVSVVAAGLMYGVVRRDPSVQAVH